MISPYDLVGPVLPQALRLSRYQAAKKLPENISDLPSENDMLNQTPSREEERFLLSNTNVVTALEDVFSFTSKDRTTRTSKLSRVESIRFQRAIYRAWLMSVLFGPRRFAPAKYGFQDNERMKREWARKTADLDKSQKEQKAFLQQFSSQELLQIRIIARFLVSTADWGVTAEGRGLGGTRETYDWKGMFLFAGPHIVLRCYEDATSDYLPTEYLDDDGLYTDFLTGAFDEIAKARKLDAPLGFVGTILDDINDEDNMCRRCSGTGLFGLPSDNRMLHDLYNETTASPQGLINQLALDWDRLKGRLLSDHQFLVPINLSCNLTEKPISQALNGDWSKLLRQMFPCRGDEYSRLSKEDWVCTSCWMSFVGDNIWRWRLYEKKKAGESIKKDCKFGYDCQQQCYERGLAHAKQFNHLCKPVEGSNVLHS